MDSILCQLTGDTLKQIVRDKKIGRVTKINRDILIGFIKKAKVTEDELITYLETQKEDKRKREEIKADWKVKDHKRNLDAMATFAVGEKVFWVTGNDGFHGHSGEHHFAKIGELENGKARVVVVKCATVHEPPRNYGPMDTSSAYAPNWDHGMGMVTVQCADLRKFDENRVYTITRYER